MFNVYSKSNFVKDLYENSPYINIEKYMIDSYVYLH